jgi:Rne/Rng family ribonuclease
MTKELVISASSHERRVAILEEGQLVEIYIEREKEFALVGSIYKGKVTRVLPGMQSAFVDIGLDGDAFLYVSDVFENLEDYDHGHATGDVAAPVIVNGHSNAPREVLPGELLGGSGAIHEEIVHLDEGHAEHALEEPAIEGLPGEVLQGRSSAHGEETGQPAFTGAREPAEPEERQPESNASAPQNFAPNYNPTRNYPPRGNDRGPNRDRGDRGGDRGRGGRRGRFGRRRGGSERPPMNQGGGRNLPPSKYASPQGDRDSRTYDNRRPNHRGGDRGPERSTDRGPIASAPNVEDEIVLPGESLAKYRSRPAPPAQVAPVVEREPEERQPNFDPTPARPTVGGLPPGSAVRRRFSGSLPHWLLAENEAEGEAIAAESGEQTISEAVENSTSAAEVEDSQPTEETVAEPTLNGVGALSDEQLGALSAQLIEAKHEETQARVSADAVVEEVEFDEEEEEDEVEFRSTTAQEQEEADAEDSEHDEVARENEEHEASARPESKQEAELRRDEEHEAAEAYREQEEKHEALQAAEGEGHQQSGAIGEHSESESFSANTHTGSLEAIQEDDVVLLPGETRAPRNPSAPREEFPRRDSARIGSNPRSRFQRPQRGGRDRDRGRGDRGGRPDRGRGGDRGRGRFEPRRSGSGTPSHGGHQRSHQGGHNHGHAPQRRPQLISEMLKAGQDVVIQIAKEPLGKKGARITSHVALPGRFLVYMPTIDHIGVSRKIASADNRSRLRRLVGEARGSYPGGFIVRTAAGDATDDEIRTDIDFLGKTWNEIKQKSEERKSPALLHRDLNLVERILRDYVSDDFTAIWIDNEEEYGKVVEFVSRFQPKLVNRVKLYTKEQPIFEEFGIQHELDKALRAKVWLKSGGYIVINHTEALVAIDVNTGKFVGKGSTRLEDTIVKTNLEAVKEIVRQIRLRDLGGIIVVDFIDMEERRNREKVLAALQFALDQDKAPSKALSFNEFGLVCITRKRTKQALERVLCQPCPSCSGSGMVKSVPTLCYEIQAEARKMAAADHEGPNLTLRVHPEIAKALKTRESLLIDELEQNSHKHIIIQSDPTLHWEQYDIY